MRENVCVRESKLAKVLDEGLCMPDPHIVHCPLYGGMKNCVSAAVLSTTHTHDHRSRTHPHIHHDGNNSFMLEVMLCVCVCL